MELVRSCSKLNVQVIGGFNKITKYFIEKYTPKILSSYVDIRYFDGHGYSNWDFVEHTNPNYFYFTNNSLLLESRVKYQKHKLHAMLPDYSITLTEVENMYRNGYLRIWDCGNLKFKMEP